VRFYLLDARQDEIDAVVISLPQRKYIVVDEYDLPCSQPLPKDIAESTKLALNKIGGRCKVREVRS